MSTWLVRKSAFPWTALGALLGEVEAVDRTEADLAAAKQFARPFVIEPATSTARAEPDVLLTPRAAYVPRAKHWTPWRHR